MLAFLCSSSLISVLYTLDGGHGGGSGGINGVVSRPLVVAKKCRWLVEYLAASSAGSFKAVASSRPFLCHVENSSVENGLGFGV